jgi:hypothetical protein
MSAVTLDLPCRQAGTAQWAAVAFAASYSSPGTRQAYATQLRLWFDWCAQHQLEPLADVRRPPLSSMPATWKPEVSPRPPLPSSWS